MGPIAEQVTASTFHSFCARNLRAFSDLIGYDKTFSIYDDEEKHSALKDVLLSMQISQEDIDNINKLPFEEKNQKVNQIYHNLSKPNNVEYTYKANYPIDTDSFFQDIRFFDGTKFKENVDIIVGGSPCQAFSSNGKRAGLEDTRGTLFYDYARLVQEIQPKAFIFENVKGLLRKSFDM